MKIDHRQSSTRALFTIPFSEILSVRKLQGNSGGVQDAKNLRSIMFGSQVGDSAKPISFEIRVRNHIEEEKMNMKNMIEENILLRLQGLNASP